MNCGTADGRLPSMCGALLNVSKAYKDRRENMGKLTIALVLLLLLAAGGGAAFLATWEIPPPISNVDKVLPNDNFPK